MRGVAPPEFRRLLGHFATGVTVVTLRRPDGRPAGMTASSLASVSLEPPLVSVGVGCDAEIHPLIRVAERWTVNILAHDQETLSRRFAETDIERFDGIGHAITPAGHVVLDGVLAHLECEPFASHSAGDHTLFLGRVVGGATRPGRPLLYYRGGYGPPA